jgi:Protein of unknown function (DUF3572)
LKLLVFLSEQSAIESFMTVTGIDLGSIRENIMDPGFQAAVLDFLLQDEPLLLAFSAHAGIAPQQFMLIRSRLPGFSAP